MRVALHQTFGIEQDLTHVAVGATFTTLVVWQMTANTAMIRSAARQTHISFWSFLLTRGKLDAQLCVPSLNNELESPGFFH